jgi:hypothetical protein
MKTALKDTMVTDSALLIPIRDKGRVGSQPAILFFRDAITELNTPATATAT